MARTAEYTKAARDAAVLREQLPAASIDFVVHPDDDSAVPKEAFKIFFELQAKCEKNPVGMDYHDYAQRLWVRAFADIPASGPTFNQFEANLIRGLHGINMKDLVYDEIRGPERLGAFVKTLYNKTKKVIMWSTGDVGATGYQNSKIASARSAHDFMRAVQNEHRSLDSLREKTGYMVADKKMAMLEKYLLDKKTAGETHVKVVVIEDSRKNIDAVVKLVQKIFRDNGEVIPVWATYSREGKKAATEPDYEVNRTKYNGVDSLAELQNPPWPEKLTDAEVLVDFDGVIGDNIRMRNAQAQVTWQSLSAAGHALNIAENRFFAQ